MDEKENFEVEETEEIAGEIHDDEAKVEKVHVSYGKKLLGRDVFDFRVIDIVEIAIFTALAVIFDQFVKIPINIGSGGSINLGMLPLFIIALRHGWFKALLAAGFIFAPICCFLDGYGIITFPLDYFVAYSSVAILGLLKPLITDDDCNVTWHSFAFSALGILASYVVRFFAATLDGVLLYNTSFIESMVYNGGYIFPSFIAVCALFLALLINILRAFRAHKSKSL